MRCAVVGHVEWVDFVLVERVPEAGEILTTNDHWAEPAGGGAVAAAELLRLGAETTFFTARGRGRAGPARRGGAAGTGFGSRSRFGPPQRRGLPTWIPGASARSPCSARSCTRSATIRAWEELDETDGVYFTAGDQAALRPGPASRRPGRHRARSFDSSLRRRSARRARPQRVIRPSGTSRASSTRRRGSSSRRRLRRWTVRRGREVAGRPRRSLDRSRTPTAPATPSPPATAFALAQGRSPQEAVELAAASGSRAMTRRGAARGGDSSF